jgi:hypothetical protein
MVCGGVDSWFNISRRPDWVATRLFFQARALASKKNSVRLETNLLGQFASLAAVTTAFESMRSVPVVLGTATDDGVTRSPSVSLHCACTQRGAREGASKRMDTACACA